MTTSEGHGLRRHARVSSLDQLALQKTVNEGGGKKENTPSSAKLSKSMFNLRTAASSDDEKRGIKGKGDNVSKRPPSGRKTGVPDGNMYLTRDLESGEEEVVVCCHGNNPGAISSTQRTTNVKTYDDSISCQFPPRLVVVSSKIRNTGNLRNALQPNVFCVQYRYDTSTLEEILRLIELGLSSLHVVSIAFVLSCAGSNILLSGKDEKVINREIIQEPHAVQDFLQTLVKTHLKSDPVYNRIDFLACTAVLTNEGRSLAKELGNIFNMPVGMSKDITGCEITYDNHTSDGNSVKTNIMVGGFYFNLDKLQGWGGHYQQSLAGFEKIRTVGKGAYGVAVLYRKKDDDSLVILKEINMHDLNVAERNLALNEVRVLAMLDHPNIISYYDSFEEDGVIMIEMEYADGGTMAQFLGQQERPLEEKEVLNLFQQMVAAIRHIHEHNILHRDLKTANIFLTKEGVVKVGDFGISKMLTSANTGANTVLGTPYYISPEMCEGKAYNDRSDIWALGCILYEIACLQKTFEGSNLPALVNKIMKGQFAPVKGNYSEELKQLIADMLLQKPEDRPSANEILYHRLPELMCRFEEETSEIEDELMSSADSILKRKRVRSVLYYLDTATLIPTPIELPSRLKIRQVAVGDDHVIAVTMERQVYTWGQGSQGQLGHGDKESRQKPQLVDTLKGKSICRACCGHGFSVFGSDNGIVMTCGDGQTGCLGHGDWCPAPRPRLIEPLLSVDVISLACGPNHVVVVGSDGEIFTWGQGGHGRLGLSTEDNHCQPMEVIALEDLSVVVREVFCGVDGTMFLTDVGSVYACGNNEANKLGLNNRQGFLMAMKNIFTKTEVEGKKIPTPVRALGRHRVIDISMGRNHSAVIVEPGHVYTFGANTEGQLGTGNTKPQNAPTEVKQLSNYTVNRVQCGDHFTTSSTTMDELFFWGLRYKTPVASELRDSLSSSGNVTLRDKDEVLGNNSTPRREELSLQSRGENVEDPNLDKVTPRSGGDAKEPNIDRVTPKSGAKSKEPNKEKVAPKRDAKSKEPINKKVTPKSGAKSKEPNQDKVTPKLGGPVKEDNVDIVRMRSGSHSNQSNRESFPSRKTDDCKESGGEGGISRRGSHSRQLSNSSAHSVSSLKYKQTGDGACESLCDVTETKRTSTDRQLSNDSVFIGGDLLPPDSDNTVTSGFRPLGITPKRSSSASSTSKDRDKDVLPEGAERYLNPIHILRLMDTDELMTLASFYCHGENIFVQVETTAPPPPRRKSRKKRSFRKRVSRNLLVPSETVQHSASSREGGDEYSSETSEMDSQGPLPQWLKQELAVGQTEIEDTADENEAGDTTDQSDEGVRRKLVDTSFTSIQINKDLKRGQNKVQKKKVSPRVERSKGATMTTDGKMVTEMESSSGRGRSLSINGAESGDPDMLSSSSSSDVLQSSLRNGVKPSGIPVKKVTMATSLKMAESPFKKASGSSSYKPLSKIRALGRGRGSRGSQQDPVLKDQLAARGFVSDVTVKRREETLQNELEKMKEEKRRSEEKIKELEQKHREEQDQLRLVAAKQAQEAEGQLKAEIEKLRHELLSHSSQLMNNQKVVMGLQEQLVRVEAEQRSINSVKNSSSNSSSPRHNSNKESKVCVLQ